MNDKCKYCDYVSKCSRICEYNSYLCKVHRSFPKVVDKSYEQLKQENQQLKDNWNKLKELTINSLDFYKETDCEYIKTQREFGIREAYRIILGKMQELEGSDSNDKD